MFKSIAYVIKENMTNLYRIYLLSLDYALLADMRDSKFGLFWNFASPAIQVITYWLVFGIGMQRSGYDGIPSLPSVIVGFAASVVHFPMHHTGLQCGFLKEKCHYENEIPHQHLTGYGMCREFFNHLCMMAITVVLLILFGYYPSVYWLGLIYYAFCAFMFLEALALVTSVLTMMWRDVKKLVTSLMRMLMYLSPVIWPAAFSGIPPCHSS